MIFSNNHIFNKQKYSKIEKYKRIYTDNLKQKKHCCYVSIILDFNYNKTRFCLQ